MNNKFELHLNAFQHTVSQYKETPDLNKRKDLIKKAAFHGVKFINLMEKPKHLTRAAAENNFNMVSIVKGIIGLLTPNEFMEVFPIRKDFKGHKWQTKDYFYTRDYMNTLDPKEPIGEETLSLLWEYVNNDITNFNVSLLMTMSDLRRLEGYPSIASEWADMERIKTMTLYEGINGKDFFIDEQGKIIKVNKNRPKYLRVVK